MIIAGKNAVREALRGGVKLQKIVLASEARPDEAAALLALAAQAGVAVQRVPRAGMDRMCDVRHQGVFAVTQAYRYATLDDLLQAPSPLLILLLDGIEDPHNLGAAIRVADCAGASGVVIPARRSAQVNETVVRTSAGATAYVPVAQVSNLNDAIRTLQKRGVTVYAADMDGDSVYRADLTGDAAVVIGSEGQGVHALSKKLADGVIALPGLGHVNSLNASVAAGALLFEAVRQRLEKGKL